MGAGMSEVRNADKVGTFIFFSGVLACVVLTWWAYLPGGWLNPHEWLNETMQKELKNQTLAEASLGKWSAGKEWAQADFQLNVVIRNITVAAINKANYSMLEVTTPDR